FHAETDFAELTFREAAPVWLASRKRIADNTRLDYEKHISRLLPFFGELPLTEIRFSHITEYRKERLKRAGASRINHEVNTVQQMLARAGLWAKIAPWYEPLPLPKKGPGIALEPEEQDYLFRVAARKPRW